MIMFNIILFSIIALGTVIGIMTSLVTSFAVIKDYLGFQYGDDI